LKNPKADFLKFIREKSGNPTLIYSEIIAVWSPGLNEKGNSCKGMKFLELFTTHTKSSIFSDIAAGFCKIVISI